LLRIKIEGSWPEPITLRRGLSLARARPWNKWVPRAYLRLERGGGTFLTECASTIEAYPALEGILSPPLLPSSQPMWIEAGFLPRAYLKLMRLDLGHQPATGSDAVVGSRDDFDQALVADAAAFPEFWRFDRPALEEALLSTRRAIVHVVRTGGDTVAGYAVTGTGSVLAYLQRIAVDPSCQGQGVGRSLVRASAAWAAARGAGALLLNTPAENLAAVALYETEGFRTLDEELVVLGRPS
jgi:GNAT superfamily N-acetyltransferase